MAILKNVEMWFAKLDPKHPNARMNKQNPTWELQLRTSNAEQKKEWEALGFKPKLIVGKEGAEDEGEPVLTPEGKKQWRINLKKKSLNKDNEPAAAVKVVNGHLEELDPNTLGNGSIGNVRIYQYEYDKADGTKALAAVLTGVQVTRHVMYIPKPREDDFEMSETETIMPAAAIPESTDDDDDDDEATPAPKATPAAPAPTPKVETADSHPEDAF
ncbi:hypothetical protein [Flavobacterium sp.]|jgi:hypothetical protein|uniref:hypothetical protein n=1 Tax=Flavobacterium sp. TaxID=239 RepID=UPI0037C18B57